MLLSVIVLLVLLLIFIFIYLFGCIGSWLQRAGCLFAGHGLNHPTWDLSSPTRDQTHVLCITRQTLNHWTTMEVHMLVLQETKLVLLVLTICRLIFHLLRNKYCTDVSYSIVDMIIHIREHFSIGQGHSRAESPFKE